MARMTKLLTVTMLVGLGLTVPAGLSSSVGLEVQSSSVYSEAENPCSDGTSDPLCPDQPGIASNDGISVKRA